MSYRIKNSDLEHLVRRINEIQGTPAEPWTRTEDDAGNTRIKANIGNYHIDGAYGGVCLHKMLSAGGGVRDVFGCGFVPKRDLYNRMSALIAGLVEGAKV